MTFPPACLVVNDPLWNVTHTFPLTRTYSDRHTLDPAFLRAEAAALCHQHMVFPNIESPLDQVHVEYREYDRKMRPTYSIDTNNKELKP